MFYKEDIESDIAVSDFTESITDTTSSYQLILWNDDVNSFDWVITTLMEVCGHTEDQAEQCAMIIHFKGKYGVKNGDYDTLKPMCNTVNDRGINATIELLIEQ